MKSTAIFFAAMIVFAWMGLALNKIAQARQAAVLDDITIQVNLNKIQLNDLRKKFDLLQSKTDAVEVDLAPGCEYSRTYQAFEDVTGGGNSLRDRMRQPEKV
jgi:hypothetical protein